MTAPAIGRRGLWHRLYHGETTYDFVGRRWIGFTVSGVLLLIGYPTKALTNPVFYLKLTLIAVAMVLLVRISRRVFAPGGAPPEITSTLRTHAIASLVCWTGAITSGRLLAYTYHRLTQLH